MNKQSYGDSFNAHLLEQYKMYVEMADRISQRRHQTNQLYITLLTGLLGVLAFLIKENTIPALELYILLTASVMGIILSVVWYYNIYAYRQLNSKKFEVIHEMEAKLPYACYDVEWQLLGHKIDSETGKKVKSDYLKLTRVERFIPFILCIPFILIFFYLLKVIF